MGSVHQFKKKQSGTYPSHPGAGIDRLKMEPEAPAKSAASNPSWKSRQLLKGEILSISACFRPDAKSWPVDFRLRVLRITLAMCALDAFDEISRRAVSSKLPPGTLASAARDMGKAFDSSFFSKGAGEAEDSYDSFRIRISTIAERCGVDVPQAYDAVKAYTIRLGKEIDRINGK